MIRLAPRPNRFCLVWLGFIGISSVISWAADSPVGPRKAYGRIELIRDTWGIPHIFADTDAGAMYGLGYAAAEERGFQMYYSLRIFQGRLSELTGERPSTRRGQTSIDHDRRMRTFGFYRAAQAAVGALDADTRALLAAYCGGVNDYLAAHQGRLHPLFAKFELKPESWTPADCIASWWHLGQFFATDGTRELIQYRNLMQGGGLSRTSSGRSGVVPPTPNAEWNDDEAAVVERGDVADEWLERVQAFAREHRLTHSGDAGGGAAGPRFSHAWVVGRQKSATGSAVLVSDPQTPVRNPSLWHEFHVRGKTFNVRGVGVPGSPGVLIGWNENVAWGATALGADQADLFRLKTDAEHVDQYFFDGEWRKMEVRRELIQVKGGKPVELTLRQTHFGPLITPFAFPVVGDPEVALKRVPICQTNRETIQALFAMMRSTNLESFTRAISAWQFPSANLVFGDRYGHIGYWLLAAVPIRSGLDTNHGAAALDGTRSEWDWQGFVPHDLLPHVIDPARGWIASANHRAIGSFYPLSLGLSTGSAGHTVRSWRLYERLGARDRFEPRDVLSIHFDTVNPARREIVQAALHLRDKMRRELSPEAGRALEYLEKWHTNGAKSELTEPGGALAGEINTFFRFVTTPLAAKFGGGESGLTRFLRELNRRIAADPNAQLNQEEQDFIDQALTTAWRSARERYGDDPATWDERARAQVAERPMGWFDSLDGFGSLDASGDVMMPPLTCVDGGTIKSQAAQSYTQYVPLHDVDSALSLLSPGHSEWADSAARESTKSLWARGELHPAPLSRSAVGKIQASRAVLSKRAAPSLQSLHRQPVE